MRPHPDLGRRGAICPYLEQATAYGRVSLSVIGVASRADFDRLREAAAGALERVRGAAQAGGRYESNLFVPYGPDPVLLVDAVVTVQGQLRAEAIGGGRMIGEFLPGHPAEGIRNPRFRPLDSPRPVLGVRTMVDTDVLFLSLPSIPPKDRRNFLDSWFRYFGSEASETLAAVYANARRALDADPSAAVRA
jgi:hypothetical protein